MIATHIMLDIETLGTRPGCTVLSAAFVRITDLASTSCVLDRADQAFAGLVEDPDTLAWWSRQEPEAWQAATANAIATRDALNHFTAWLDWAAPAVEDRLIWCHGATFDAPILEEVYRLHQLSAPWSFRNVRCARTLFDLAGVDLYAYSNGAAHNALADATAQARAALDALAGVRSAVG